MEFFAIWATATGLIRSKGKHALPASRSALGQAAAGFGPNRLPAAPELALRLSRYLDP